MKHQISNQKYQFTLTLIALILTLLTAGCDQDQVQRNEENINQDDTVVLLKPSNPTHKVVCSCTCGNTDGAPKETHDVPKSGSCDDLNGIECSSAKLNSCSKKSVPAALQLKITNKLLKVRQ